MDQKIKLLYSLNAVILILIVGLILNQYKFHFYESGDELLQQTNPAISNVMIEPISLAPIIKKVNPSVVNITTKGNVAFNNNPFFQDPFFNNIFRNNMMIEKEVQSIGSGVVYDAMNGYILTNYHVVKDADQIFVTLFDERKLLAELVGSDPEIDLAVLQIDSDNLMQVSLAINSQVQVGDHVIAIGNPFGLGHTVTYGIVSALERANSNISDGYERLIQTDASINPGNSGGALVDLKGQLIGINTAIFSSKGSSVGIGFAIPVDVTKKIADQLIEFGEIKRGTLGLVVRKIHADERFSLEGVVIEKILQDSVSQIAGLMKGDLIIAMNDFDISNPSDFNSKLSTFRVGEEISIMLLRDKRKMKKLLIIQAIREQDEALLFGISPPLDVAVLNGAIFKTVSNGIEILSVEINSNAYRIGLQAGDLIQAINQKSVNNTEEMFVAARNKKQGIIINLKRNNQAILIIRN
ncbi:MAG: serine protease Do/serine protease DegQ [Chloroflexi bacterium]|nr:MAG: serine protease Do/serine protease DegQ [Chloroflexota bacterium]